VLGLLVSTGILIPAVPSTHAKTIATIWYVVPGGTGTEDCSSWTDACSLDVALNNGFSNTEIWAATGVYTPGMSSYDTFQLQDGVALYGGFDPDSSADQFEERDWEAFPTVLSGDVDGNDTTDANGVVTTTHSIAGNNSLHVVTASVQDSTAVLDGFTITGGNANGFDLSDECGGGMYNEHLSRLTLTNVTFSGNTAAYRGGGMYNEHLSILALSNVTFSNNTATLGGGMSNSSSSAALTNVSFSGNRASFGGGMHNWSSSPTLTNITFSGNLAGNYGGGMYNQVSSSPSVRNSILWNNRDSSGTGTLSASIYNNSSTVTLTLSLAQGSGGSASWTSDPSYVDGGGNLDSDPLFVQPIDPIQAPIPSGDLHLQAGSPAINTGDNQYVTGILTDLDGNPRISGEIVDMGAYESQFYTLTVSLDGTGAGTVDADGISCATGSTGADCTENYADGTVITITASANSGSTFAGWSGDCTNASGDCVVTMDAAKSVTTTFTLDQHALSVTVTGDGSGSVSSVPSGITCTSDAGSDCSETYDYSTVVTLTANPDSGSTFSGWSGVCTNTSGDCVATMDTDIILTATFEVSGPAEVFLPLIQQNH
jgi:predicted outer membrane repeat protein